MRPRIPCMIGEVVAVRDLIPHVELWTTIGQLEAIDMLRRQLGR